MDKVHFLKKEFLEKLKALSPDEKPRWGLMNVQQMIEHMSDSVRQANGKVPKTILTAPEHLERVKTFMMSDKPFKENTRNSEMADTPSPVKHSAIENAIEELATELNDFFKVFEKEPDKIITNPFFGHLNFNEWVHLLHKHAIHHLKQFGIE